MNFLRKLHPVFQFIIIGVLLVLYIYLCFQFHVAFFHAAALAFVAMAIGASILSHVENQLQYNLEDKEEDALKRIEQYASAEAKSAILKLRSLAAMGKKA